MKQLRLLSYLSVLVISFLVLRFPAPAYATTLYSENFSGTSGTHLEDHETHWVRNTGNPEIDLNGDGTASAVGETHYAWDSTQSINQNVQFDFQVHTTAGRNYYAISFREIVGGGYNNNDQVYMEINSDYSGRLFNADSSISHSFPAGYFTEGDWHTLNATYDTKDMITAYLDGVSIDRWHSFQTNYAIGDFGISVDNGSIRNLTYTDDVNNSPTVTIPALTPLLYSESFSGSAGQHLEDHETHWVRNTGNPEIDLNGDGTASAVGLTVYSWNSTQSTSQDIQMDFKAEANANDNNLYGILFRQNGGDVVDQVYLNINNDYSGHLYNATGSISHNFPAGYFTEGQWYTLRGTYDNNSHVSAYLNGVLIEQWHSVDTSVAEGSFAIELWNGTIRNLTYKGDIGVTINRNDTYAVSGSFSDPDSASWSATVDYGDGSGTSPLTLSGTNFSLNHTYTTAGTYTVTVSVTDNQGLTGTQTEKIIVTNYAPPSVTMPSNSTKNVGDTYSGSGSFTDTDSSSWTATVNYGDGSGTQPLTLSGMTFSLSHTYSSVGTYTVTVTVTDNQGASGQASATVTVQRQLTTLTSAQVWLERGLLTPGLKLDVLAQVYKDSTLVSSGQLNSVNVGSGILFNGATQVTVPFNAFTPVNFPTGSALKMTVSVRNACSGSTANGGNARLWYNDGSANSHFGATIGTSTNSYYLLSGNALGTSAGNNRQNIVVASGTRCSAFKPFGTWTITP